MIPLLRAFFWSLLWDEAAAGRACRGLLLALALGVQPVAQAYLDGRGVSPGRAGVSIALAAFGALAGWLRAGQKNDGPAAGGQ
jgi:hypothetical protein